MNLNKLYKMQEELDNTILKNEVERTGIEIDKDRLLNQTILALQVEIAELANATRVFKHWSTKKAESRERLLDEYADILHFYLSIGNQLYNMGQEVRIAYASYELFKEEYEDTKIESPEWLFIKLLYCTAYLEKSTRESLNRFTLEEVDTGRVYKLILKLLFFLARELDFTEKEIEQAYFKKHKVNYDRQEEGY